ncbi:MAG: hypothetical protein A4E68_01947 [Syntrophaceae bacterium PtaB.Bin095]|nr:MAG: hypothetical protein A4E68_01947 [Syntrophaceae bacterium PtaB.Bin095]
MVVAWGDDTAGQSTVPGDISDVIAVAAGDLHSLALKPDGKVKAWGSNANGQTSVPAALSLTPVMAVAAGSSHSLALRSNGSVKGWGDNTYGQTTAPAGLDLRIRFRVPYTGKGISPGILMPLLLN